MMVRTLQPVLTGLVSAVVGYASAFSIVLAGLRAVGADSRQAASGLLALCVGIAIAAAVLSVRYRMPVAVAWSTPGAALLVATGHVEGGYPAAIGAFAVCGVLTVLAGIVPWLARGVAAIPGPIAAAMLAGCPGPAVHRPAPRDGRGSAAGRAGHADLGRADAVRPAVGDPRGAGRGRGFYSRSAAPRFRPRPCAPTRCSRCPP